MYLHNAFMLHALYETEEAFYQRVQLKTSTQRN